MEEAFKREKEEADRLLREQKLEYESKIVELQKQVMETSMSQSMLSSILSSSGFVDTSTFIQQQFQQDFNENDNDTLSCKIKNKIQKDFSLHVYAVLDCSWSEQDYQLAWWAWKKWRYHQMTSLRVNFVFFLKIDNPQKKIYIFQISLGLFKSYSTYMVDKGSYLSINCFRSLSLLNVVWNNFIDTFWFFLSRIFYGVIVFI